MKEKSHLLLKIFIEKSMNILNIFKLWLLDGSFQDVPKSSVLPRKARGNRNGVAVFEAHKGLLSEEFIVPHTPKARNLIFNQIP